jgi:uncharacterized protein (TIGR03437 family)
MCTRLLRRIFCGCLLLSAGVIAHAQSPNSWTLGTPMPTAREGPITGVIGNNIYVVSGDNNSSVLTVNEIYDTVSGTWSTGAPIPTGRYLGASAVVNNILYAMGGLTASGVSTSVEAYDPSTNTWSTKAPMPGALDSMYAVTDNGLIYVIGGLNGNKSASLLSYNPATNSWTVLAPMAVAKSCSAVGAFGATIISATGLAAAGVSTDNEGYNVSTNKWSTLPSSPTARNSPCFGVIGTKLYLAGGNGIDNSTQTNTVDAYDDSANSWSTGLATMPQAVGVAGSAVAGGRLYCFGGSNSGLPLQGTIYASTQIYVPPTGPPSISSGGVVSASAFGEFTSVSPGSWIEIYGSSLAADTRGWTTADFTGINAPTNLDGTTVTIGGQPAFIDYISPTQVNALVPSNVGTGPQQLVLTTAAGMSAPYNMTVNAAEPGLLATSSFNVGGVQYVVAFHGDGTYVLPVGAISGLTSSPAEPGEVITLYGVGFGPVTPNIPAGQLVQQLNSLSLPLQMEIGGMPAGFEYDGLAPNYTGLYQFNVTVPNAPANNALPLSFNLGGAPGTQTLYIAVN